MLGVILIIGGGFVCLALWASFLIGWRAKLISEGRAEIEDRGKKISSEDCKAFEQLISTLFSGKPYFDAVSQFLKQRAELVPELVTELPGRWMQDECQLVLRKAMKQKSEAVNRKLFVPASISFLSIIATTAITAAITWSFIAPENVESEITKPPSEALEPFDPFKDFPETQSDTNESEPPTGEPK